MIRPVNRSSIYLSLGVLLPLSCLSLQGEEVPGDPGTADPAQAPVRPPLESGEMMQREIDRRREMTFRHNEMLELAERLYQSGEWDSAQAKFDLVLLQTDSQSQARGFHERARIGKAKCLVAKAMAKKKAGQITEATGLMQQAVELDPLNKSLARLAKEMQEESSRESDPFPLCWI